MRTTDRLVSWLSLTFSTTVLALLVWGNTCWAQEEGSQQEPAADSQVAAAPDSRTDSITLATGMSYQEVVRLLGSPQERKEQETLRQVIWIYRGRKLFFKEGKLVAWTSATTTFPSSNTTILHAGPSEEKDDESIREILGELLENSGKAAAIPDTSTPVPETQPGIQFIPPAEMVQ